VTDAHHLTPAIGVGASPRAVSLRYEPPAGPITLIEAADAAFAGADAPAATPPTSSDTTRTNKVMANTLPAPRADTRVKSPGWPSLRHQLSGAALPGTRSSLKGEREGSPCGERFRAARAGRACERKGERRGSDIGFGLASQRARRTPHL